MSVIYWAYIIYRDTGIVLLADRWESNVERSDSQAMTTKAAGV